MFFFFFFNDTATTEIYTLSLHDALPISGGSCARVRQKTDGQFPVTQRCAATRLPPCSKEQTGDRLAVPATSRNLSCASQDASPNSLNAFGTKIRLSGCGQRMRPKKSQCRARNC